MEAARLLAQKMIAEGGATPAERVSWAFRRATGRPPAPAELGVLTAGLTKRLEHFARDGDSAQKLVSFGAAPVAAEPAAELAAYTVTANVLLNLDEVVTRE